MVHTCLSCIPTEHCKPLPEDVWMDILSKLSAKDLLRCQRVCRRWNSLISTPHFNNLYMNRGAVPAIMVVQPSLRAETNLIFLQDCDQGSRCKKILVNSKVCGAYELCPELEFSHHGFLVFSHPQNLSLHSIVNPVTLGQHTFITTWGRICGLFSHPVTKEYYVLCVRHWTFSFEFKMVRLDVVVSNSLNFERGWKVCNNLRRKMHNILNGEPFVISAVHLGHPIITKDIICWKLQLLEDYDSVPCELSIMIFDIKKEEFDVISHPGGKCDNQVNSDARTHRQMHLFEMEGHVSFCKFSYSRPDYKLSMHIWILEEDHSTWSRRETIILDMTQRIHGDACLLSFEPIGTLNGELIICCGSTEVFAYNLQQRTTRELTEWEDIMKNSYLSKMCIYKNNINVSWKKKNSKIQNRRSTKPKLTCLLSKLKKHLLQRI